MHNEEFVATSKEDLDTICFTFLNQESYEDNSSTHVLDLCFEGISGLL